MAPIDERLTPVFRIALLTLSLIASGYCIATEEVALAALTEQDYISEMPVVLSVSR